MQSNVQNWLFGSPIEDVWELNYDQKEYTNLKGEKLMTVSNDGNYLAMMMVLNPLCYFISLPMRCLLYQKYLKLDKQFKPRSLFFSKCSQHLLLILQNQVIWFDIKNPNNNHLTIKFTQKMFHFTTNENDQLFLITQNNQIFIYNLINAQQINIINGNRWYYNMESNSVHIYAFQKDTILINVNFCNNYVEGIIYLLNTQNGKTLKNMCKYENIFKQPFYTPKLSYQIYENKTDFCFKIYHFHIQKLIRKINLKKTIKSHQSLKEIKYILTNNDLLLIIVIIDRWTKVIKIVELHCIRLIQRVLCEYPNFDNIYITFNSFMMIQNDQKKLKLTYFKKI